MLTRTASAWREQIAAIVAAQIIAGNRCRVSIAAAVWLIQKDVVVAVDLPDQAKGDDIANAVLIDVDQAGGLLRLQAEARPGG